VFNIDDGAGSLPPLFAGGGRPADIGERWILLKTLRYSVKKNEHRNRHVFVRCGVERLDT